jgi:hypothetical protein
MTGNKRSLVVLQDRDRHLLEELSLMRVINREQAKVVGGFGSTTRVNTRLLALTRAGLLKRSFIGSNEAAYMLAGTSVTQPGGVPAILFAKHQLAINSVYLRLRYQPLPAGVRVLRWMRFDETLSKTIPLIPDAYFELESSGTIRPVFLEADLGTEALNVWQRKTQLYLQLALSGEFAKIFQQAQFRVLVVANTERRLGNIRSTIAKSTDKIFWFSTFDTINREGFWSPTWLRPTGGQRLSLL